MYISTYVCMLLISPTFEFIYLCMWSPIGLNSDRSSNTFNSRPVNTFVNLQFKFRLLWLTWGRHMYVCTYKHMYFYMFWRYANVLNAHNLPIHQSVVSVFHCTLIARLVSNVAMWYLCMHILPSTALCATHTFKQTLPQPAQRPLPIGFRARA